MVVTGLSGGITPEDAPLLARGVEVIERMGFRVRVSPFLTPERTRWWAAGTPAEIAAELNSLLRDPEVRAIVSHTGGRVVSSYLDLIDLDAVRADPKPILGYSDISLLHLALHSQTGLVGLHADIATHGFGGDWFTIGDEARRDELIGVYRSVLCDVEPLGALPPGSQWETWRPGTATGPLVGGLLKRLVALQATGFALAPERFDGAILFWEEVAVSTVHVWSDLHALRQAGILERIAGMVVGTPTDVAAEPGGPEDLREVVMDVVGGYRFPILGHVDFGHCSPNLPMPIGVAAHLDATARTLSLCEPAVAHP